MKKIMNKFLKTSIFTLCALGLNAASFAAERGTIDEAIALVQKAKAYIKTNGNEKAYAAFSNPKGEFIDRDLYIFVFDKKGNTLAHGGNQRLIGKNLYELKDVTGLYSTQVLLETAQKGGGKSNFKFLNPKTKAIESKTGYSEMVGDIMVGSGAYEK
jgi:cytochrome c